MKGYCIHLTNIIISLEIVWTGIIALNANPQGVNCNCVKFYQYQSID